MKTKPKISKASIGLLGLILLILAVISLLIGFSIQYGFDVVIKWFISPQALLAYLIIFIVVVLCVPIVILIKINKR